MHQLFFRNDSFNLFRFSIHFQRLFIEFCKMFESAFVKFHRIAKTSDIILGNR